MTNARASITDTAQTAAENAAGAVGSLLNNDTVGSAIDKVGEFYRKNPLVSKIGIAIAVAAIASIVTSKARR